MELPSSLIANREAFRRSLQTSLHDVLGDVGLDGGAAQLNLAGLLSNQNQASRQGPSLQLPKQLPNLSALESSLLNRTGSMLSQSLGSPASLPSSLGLSRATENLILAKAAEDRILSQAAKAAFLHQTIAAQQNKQAVQEAYIKYLQNQLAATQSMQSLPSVSNLGLGLPSGSTHGLFDLAAAASSTNRSIALPPPETTTSVLATKQKIAQTLKALGTNLRSRYDPFIDCIDIEDPEEEAARRSRGGVSEHFPERLHRMLLDVELEGKSEIVSFYSHGRAFGVHDMDRFISEIMPKYFKQSKWNSFARQLNLYGFMRLASGPDASGYYHELFLKGRPTLARYMRRVGVPQGQQDRRKCRPKNVVDIQEPDFYSMRPSLLEEGAEGPVSEQHHEVP